ncbi:hypothetical protein ARMSODRAFT_1087411 [Armillaria solidipes]|uniref:DUF6535 domain-containing protein n=1 Tax=Armillaria solidipes TaxID=1076256 RepID=A0A2H3B3T6_9AGAR|nr:hypothetical protein ARMSODRAFT_1087411 [Armillaria solidipes]
MSLKSFDGQNAMATGTVSLDGDEEFHMNNLDSAARTQHKNFDCFPMYCNDPLDYEGKYPEDATYEETAPNARVWKAHSDQSAIFDADMVEESRDNIDVLLVFAGLFSAVVTIFVVQTSQDLSPDYAQISASLLYELVSNQREIVNRSSIIPSSYDPSAKFIPSATSVWVNGLWFTSLVLSLTAALVAVFVKQWLHYHVSIPSGTPRERSLIRHFRYMGFQKWHVPVIIGLLPLFMHASLALFLLGLVVFLIPLQAALAWFIGAIAATVYVAYSSAIFLSILFPQCPYHTPISDLTYLAYSYISQRLIFFLGVISARVSSGRFTFPSPGGATKVLKNLEFDAVTATSKELFMEALRWLFSSSSNSSVHSLVIQAIGGLPISSRAVVWRIFGKARDIWDALLSSYGDEGEPRHEMERKIERLLKSELFIPHIYFDSHLTEGNRYHHDYSPDNLQLAASIHAHPAFPSAVTKPRGSHMAWMFLQYALATDAEFPAIVWSGLVRNAVDEGAFKPSPLSDDQNMFPLILCRGLHVALRYSRSSAVSVQSSYFSIAVRSFVQEMFDDLLAMCSSCSRYSDQESLSKRLRVILALTEFAISRSRSVMLNADVSGASLLRKNLCTDDNIVG